MAKMQDVRKTIEGSLGNLTPTRAQEIADAPVVCADLLAAVRHVLGGRP